MKQQQITETSRDDIEICKKSKTTLHHAKFADQLSFTTRFPRSEATYIKQGVNQRHHMQGQYVVEPETVTAASVLFHRDVTYVRFQLK